MTAKPAPARHPLSAAERTAKILKMRWSAPVGKGTDTVNIKVAGSRHATI